MNTIYPGHGTCFVFWFILMKVLWEKLCYSYFKERVLSFKISFRRLVNWNFIQDLCFSHEVDWNGYRNWRLSLLNLIVDNITCFKSFLVNCICVSDFKIGLWAPWEFGGSGVIYQVETTITFDCSRNVCEPNADWATHCPSELLALCVGNSFSATWSSSEQIPFSHSVFSKWCYRALEHLQKEEMNHRGSFQFPSVHSFVA